MRKAIIASAILAALAGCATPVSLLKNPTTGQVARCGGGVGGSIGGGVIGYTIEKSNDEKCVQEYQTQGFKRIQ